MGAWRSERSKSRQRLQGTAQRWPCMPAAPAAGPPAHPLVRPAARAAAPAAAAPRCAAAASAARSARCGGLRRCARRPAAGLPRRKDGDKVGVPDWLAWSGMPNSLGIGAGCRCPNTWAVHASWQLLLTFGHASTRLLGRLCEQRRRAAAQLCIGQQLAGCRGGAGQAFAHVAGDRGDRLAQRRERKPALRPAGALCR